MTPNLIYVRKYLFLNWFKSHELFINNYNIANSYKERFNSAKEIGHLHNDFNNSTANRTFNENQFDGIYIIKYII